MTGTFAFGLAASALAVPPHGGGPAGDKAKSAEHAGKPERASDKDKGDKDKGDKDKGDKAEAKKGSPDKDDKGDKGDKEKAEKGDEGDKDKPGAPPGLQAKDDEHHKKLLERFEERKKTIAERAKGEREEIRKKWHDALDRPPVQEELRRHAMTVARLERIKEIAEASEKPELGSRAQAALEKENARHDKRMAELKSQAAPAASAGGAQ